MEELHLGLGDGGAALYAGELRAAPDAHASIAPVVEPIPSAVTFAEFYSEEFDGAVRLAKVLTGSWEVARDVAQDAFCGMHRHWRRIDQPHAYLRRSVVNGSTSVQRRRRRDAERPTPRPESTELGADELADALAALPPRQRAAIVLRHHLDLPDAAIADALGVRVGTVASLVHRGLAQLRTALSDPPPDFQGRRR